MEIKKSNVMGKLKLFLENYNIINEKTKNNVDRENQLIIDLKAIIDAGETDVENLANADIINLIDSISIISLEKRASLKSKFSLATYLVKRVDDSHKQFSQYAKAIEDLKELAGIISGFYTHLLNEKSLRPKQIDEIIHDIKITNELLGCVTDLGLQRQILDIASFESLLGLSDLDEIEKNELLEIVFIDNLSLSQRQERSERKQSMGPIPEVKHIIQSQKESPVVEENSGNHLINNSDYNLETARKHTFIYLLDEDGRSYLEDDLNKLSQKTYHNFIELMNHLITDRLPSEEDILVKRKSTPFPIYERKNNNTRLYYTLLADNGILILMADDSVEANYANVNSRVVKNKDQIMKITDILNKQGVEAEALIRVHNEINKDIKIVIAK